EEARGAMALAELRSTVLRGVHAASAVHGHHKSYEGRMIVHFPDAFTGPEEDGYGIELHCYVLGPSRGYEWKGKTLYEAAHAALEDVRRWVDQELEEHLS